MDGSKGCPDCGAPREGAKIVDGRYSIEAELGRGGMGVVYRARDLGLFRDVALKLITPHLLRDKSAIESFKQEARGLAAIRNDNVVQVYAFGRHEASLFFAMELVVGRTLEYIIESHKEHGAVIPRSRALAILKSVAHGLDAVHDAGLLHRDVKPENIVIEERTGRPVLIDFGLALKLETLSNGAEAVAGGSPAYAAPEQLDQSRPLSRSSDLFAFACTAYELFTNDLPYGRATTIRELMALRAAGTFAPPSSLRPELAVVDATFRRALASDPDLRHGRCGQLVEELAERLAVDFSDIAVADLNGASPASRIEGSRAGVARVEGAKETRSRVALQTGPPSRRPELSVLVVDDDPFFAKFAAHAVNLAFHGTHPRITIVPNGFEALREAEQNPPQLVLLDYDMPGMNGIEVLTKLRDLPMGPAARVLVLSATAGERERWRFDVLGINDFKPKPIPIRTLLETLDRLTKDAGWRQAAVPRR